MFKKLLVPLDCSPLAEQALGQAGAIAKASHAEIDVILVHQAIPFAGFEDAPWNADQLKDEHKYVETIADELTSGAGVSATHALMRGDPAEQICLRAMDIGADLIVMTSHGRTGFSRAWIGSVADGVIRHSTIPVLMLRPVEGKTRRDATKHLFKHILVPDDGSTLAAGALSSAVAMAKCSAGCITLVRVAEPVPLITPDIGMAYGYMLPIQDDKLTEKVYLEAREQVSAAARRLSGKESVMMDAVAIVSPSIAQGILEIAASRKADLIAMSTHGRGASRLFIGSVADKVLRASGLPVLLYRPSAVRAEPPMLTAESVAEQLPALSGL